jgi:large subunit ribosomal protein L30
MEKQLKITQIRSAIGKLVAQKRTIKALGIKKMHGSVVHTDSAVLQGMINAVRHLVKVEEVTVPAAAAEKVTVASPVVEKAIVEEVKAEEANAE